MLKNSQTGATFEPNEIGWIDFETLNRTENIKAVGTYRYAAGAEAVMLAFALGADAPQVVSTADFPCTMTWSEMPSNLVAFHERVLRGEAVYAAWHAAFDRCTWNYACVGFPFLEPHMVIDVMVQSVASGLAPDLARASAMCGGEYKKDERGKYLIRLFCMPDAFYAGNLEKKRAKVQRDTAKPVGKREAPKPWDEVKLPIRRGTPLSHPKEWREFINYAGDDIESMRSVFRHTRQLPYAEWRQYWAGERINERGVGIDLRMVEHAAALAAEDARRSSKEVTRITHGAVTSVNQVAKMTDWFLERLPLSRRDVLIKRVEEVDEETGVITKPAKKQLTRKQVMKLIALLSESPETPANLAMLRLAQIRLYGGSKTPVKYSRMLEQQIDNVLYGQYAFNGAPQTGRFSSKGVQIHNLSRDFLKAEPDLINALLHDCSYDTFAKLGGDDPVARKLALLIRPSLVPAEGNCFVWSDWAQIEARITPWLCGDDYRAEDRLQDFRDFDRNPKKNALGVPKDLYTRTTADLFHLPIDEITKDMRQRGKVAELALGFLGGAGALQNMAANYGLFFETEEAWTIVNRWREANQWCVDFGDAVWNAMRQAHRFPNTYVPVGRIGFIFLSNYLGGSLLMRLPSGRCLTYRRLRWEEIEILDDDDQPTGEIKVELTFRRGGYTPITIWKGLLVENAVQSTAADFLRGTIVRLEDDADLMRWMPIRLHTHDELLAETAVQRAAEAAGVLREIMQRGFDWSVGLPIMSDETIAYAYTKHEGSFGL